MKSDNKLDKDVTYSINDDDNHSVTSELAESKMLEKIGFGNGRPP